MNHLHNGNNGQISLKMNKTSQNNQAIIYKVLPTHKFNSDIKFYIRKKKFKKLPDDIREILKDIKSGKFPGSEISNLKLKNDENQSVYKVRAKNSNTKVGKSNGYRIIYYVRNYEKIIFLVTIYYKKDDIRIPTNNEIIQLIKRYCI